MPDTLLRHPCLLPKHSEEVNKFRVLDFSRHHPRRNQGLAQMYANGMCPSAADGTRLPSPKGCGAILCTCSVCALLEIGFSFMTPRLWKKMFPPIVTGPTVFLIGASLIQSGLEGWAGEAGQCLSRPTEGISQNCPTNFAPHASPRGSAEFIGMGFSGFVTIILCERFGSPIMKSRKFLSPLLTHILPFTGRPFFCFNETVRKKLVSQVSISTLRIHTL